MREEDLGGVVVFGSLSAILLLIYWFKLENVYGWMDIPTHIAFGYLTGKIFRGNPVLCTTAFLGWEVIEHVLSYSEHDFLHRFFSEPMENKIRDVICDYIGYIISRLK